MVEKDLRRMQESAARDLACTTSPLHGALEPMRPRASQSTTLRSERRREAEARREASGSAIVTGERRKASAQSADGCTELPARESNTPERLATKLLATCDAAAASSRLRGSTHLRRRRGR